MFYKTENYWQNWTRIICVMALFTLGFAHQTPALSKSSAIDISAYLLPDGSLPVFCLSNNGSSRSGSQNGHCEACRLSASVDIPTAPALAIKISTPILLEQNFVIEHFTVHQSYPPSAPPRAPPIS